MYQITAADIGKNTLYGNIEKTLAGGHIYYDSYDLDNFITSGEYVFMATSVAHSPSNATRLTLYVSRYESDAFVSQMAVLNLAADYNVYARRKNTNGWTDWKSLVFSDDAITTLTAQFSSSLSLNSNSHIYAYRYQKLVFISGFLMTTTDDDIPNNTVIGTVSGITLKEQVFDSPNGSDGDTSRIKLTKSGSLQIEKVMKGRVWYSFSFTGLIA